jgi:hypothetical protein
MSPKYGFDDMMAFIDQISMFPARSALMESPEGLAAVLSYLDGMKHAV